MHFRGFAGFQFERVVDALWNMHAIFGIVMCSQKKTRLPNRKILYSRGTGLPFAVDAPAGGFCLDPEGV